MKNVKITVLACHWEILLPQSAPVAPWPLSLLKIIFSESSTVVQNGGWTIADFWVKSTLGQIRFQDADVFDIGILFGSKQGSNNASRLGIINLAINQARQRGIDLVAGSPIVVFIDPPPSDAGAIGVQFVSNALLDRGAEHTFLAHEIGHIIGYNHSTGPNTNSAFSDYFNPYCMMSARTFGNTNPTTNTTPSGVSIPTGLPAYFWSNPSIGGMGSGPLACAAQTYLSLSDFANGPNVLVLPQNYLGYTKQITITSLSEAAFTDTVLIVVKTVLGHFFVEYRTASGWDRGLVKNNPTPGIIIHKVVSSSPTQSQFLANIPIAYGSSNFWKDVNDAIAVKFIGTVSNRSDLAIVEIIVPSVPKLVIEPLSATGLNSCNQHFVEGTSETFDIKNPEIIRDQNGLTYMWNVVGAVGQSSTSPTLTIKNLPLAGTRVEIKVTITNFQGIQATGKLVFRTNKLQNGIIEDIRRVNCMIRKIKEIHKRLPPNVPIETIENTAMLYELNNVEIKLKEILLSTKSVITTIRATKSRIKSMKD